MKQTFFLLLIIIMFWPKNQLSAQKGEVTDSRDGKTYKTVQFGDQTWLAQNLDFESENSYWYNNKKKYGNKHGRLYTWGDALKVCPSGWHLPSDKEWTKLINLFGGGIEAGLELKVTGSSGFDVYFSGFRDSVGTYYDLGHDANFWTSTSVGIYEAWRCYFDRGYTEIVQDYFSKAGALSVRCIKD